MSSKAADTVKQLMLNDGVVNPSGAVFTSVLAGYALAVPLSSYLTKPDGVLQRVVERTLLKLVPGGVAEGRKIAALSAVYTILAYPTTGVLSVVGQAMGRQGRFDNNHPRQHINDLRGLPLRLRSAHYGLLESFPSFAIAASLAQYLAPKDQQIINLLGLHVLLKGFAFWVAYVGNVAPLRSLVHIVGTSAVVNVLLRLANTNSE